MTSTPADRNVFTDVLRDVFDDGTAHDTAPVEEPANPCGCRGEHADATDRRETSAGRNRNTRPTLATAATELLNDLGVGNLDATDEVISCVEAAITAAGLDAGVVSLRWKVLTLSSDAATCALLRFEAPKLLDAVAASHPGTVTDIRVRVRRARDNR